VLKLGFKLEKCVSYITENSIKQISDKFSKQLEEKGITRIQWIALYYLNSNEEISQKDLAKKMSIKDSSVARLLDRMKKEELIERVKSEEDRRVTYIHLTEKGKEMIERLLPEGEVFSCKMLEDVSEEELEIFENVIRKMVANSLK